MSIPVCGEKVAIKRAEEMRHGRFHIRYIRTTFVPEDGRCMCLFEAGSESEAEDTFGHRIPLSNNAIRPHRDDRVERGLENGNELFEQRAWVVACRHEDV